MSFPLTPASPFVDYVSKVPASTLNSWRTYFSQALDAVNGGTYALAADVTISAGGGSWTFENPVRFDATGSVAIGPNVTVTVENNGLISLAGASGNLAKIEADTYGVVDILSGGQFISRSGSAFTLASGADVTAAISTAGSTWSQTAGNFNIGSSVNATITYGSVGLVTHGNGSALVHANGSAETHASGSADVYSSGSTLTLGGTTTRTGSMILSGTSALTGIRETDLAVWVGTHTLTTPYDYDVYNLPASFAADVDLVLDVPGSPPSHTVYVTLWRPNGLYAVNVKNTGGGTAIIILNPQLYVGATAPVSATLKLRFGVGYWELHSYSGYLATGGVSLSGGAP